MIGLRVKQPSMSPRVFPRVVGYLLTAMLIGGFFAQVQTSVQAQNGGFEFLPGFEDVPKAPGLAAQEADVLVFDSPAGRIVEVYAVGAENWLDVTTFYSGTLQQLGWVTRNTSEESVRFVREGEVLTLDRFGADGALTVRFTLAPGQ